MKIYNINNVPAFLQRVRSCSGNVSLEDKNGNRQDLKALARQLEIIEPSLAGAKLSELTVYFEKSEDCFRMTNYLAEMALVG